MSVILTVMGRDLYFFLANGEPKAVMSKSSSNSFARLRMKAMSNARRRRADARAHRAGLRVPPADGCAAGSAQLLDPRRLTPRPGSARSCRTPAERFAPFDGESGFGQSPGTAPRRPARLGRFSPWFLFLCGFCPLSPFSRSFPTRHAPCRSSTCLGTHRPAARAPPQPRKYHFPALSVPFPAAVSVREVSFLLLNAA